MLSRWGFPTNKTLEPVKVGYGFVGRLDEITLHDRARSPTDGMRLFPRI